MFACQECGHKFRSTKAAERASMNGCPKCRGVDIDLDVNDWLGIDKIKEDMRLQRSKENQKSMSKSDGNLN